jgi:hypothetical protein
MCPTATKADYERMHSSHSAFEEAERYAYEFVSRVRALAADEEEKADEEATILVASLKDGCEVQFVNDARGSGSPVNVEFCEVIYDNWPHLFLV